MTLSPTTNPAAKSSLRRGHVSDVVTDQTKTRDTAALWTARGRTFWTHGAMRRWHVDDDGHVFVREWDAAESKAYQDLINIDFEPPGD
jgi:hypothetical protein